MKKGIILSVLVIANMAFLFTSCKGDKKDKKVENTTKEVVKEAEKKAEEVKETTKEVKAELSEQAKQGLVIIKGKGLCHTCHKDEGKLIGPSYKEMAKIYKEKNGNIVKFLKGEAKPIVDPAQYELMKPNLEVTKKMSGDELAALAAYIRTFE